MATATPTLDVVANAMLSALDTFLPAGAGGLPAPGVIMINLRERSAGIGHHLGTTSVADFGVVALKGLRLEGVARFQLWAASPADIDAAIASLNLRILAGRDSLWSKGFLKIDMKDAKPAQNIPDVGWRRSADYRVLFEFPYQGTDDSESLLARIPIGINSVFNEFTLVTDRMSRWDDLSAPKLATRGRVGITALSVLSFVPGASPTGSVTLTRTFDGATGPPTPAASMADFLTKVGGDVPAEKHTSVTFASLTAFLGTLGAAGAPITLGDWDGNGIPDQYQPLTLDIQAPIQLADVGDRFEIAYSNPAFDHSAVLYLRLAHAVAG
jgi:hypothetical protein